MIAPKETLRAVGECAPQGDFFERVTTGELQMADMERVLQSSVKCWLLKMASYTELGAGIKPS